MSKKPQEDIYWFEKKYGIDITKYNQARTEKFEKEGVFEECDEDTDEE